MYFYIHFLPNGVYSFDFCSIFALLMEICVRWCTVFAQIFSPSEMCLYTCVVMLMCKDFALAQIGASLAHNYQSCIIQKCINLYCIGKCSFVFADV